jgi:hypothetical protein
VQALASTELGAAFRAEVARRWSRPALRRLAVCLAAILPIQALAGMAGPWCHAHAYGYQGWALLFAFRLDSWHANGLLGALRTLAGGDPTALGSALLLLPAALWSASYRFLLPAYAALAFASGRSRTADESLPSGLSRRQAFGVRGLAAVLPIAIFALAAAPGLALAYALRLQSWEFWMAAPAVLTLLFLPIDFLVQTTLLLALSARLRHRDRALAACYGISLIVIPAVVRMAGFPGQHERWQGIPFGPTLVDWWMVSLPFAWMSNVGAWVVVTGLELVALCFLLPRALRRT